MGYVRVLYSEVCRGSFIKQYVIHPGVLPDFASLNPNYTLRARVPDAMQRECAARSGAPLIRDRHTQSSLRRLRKLVCAP